MLQYIRITLFQTLRFSYLIKGNFEIARENNKNMIFFPLLKHYNKTLNQYLIEYDIFFLSIISQKHSYMFIFDDFFNFKV